MRALGRVSEAAGCGQVVSEHGKITSCLDPLLQSLFERTAESGNVALAEQRTPRPRARRSVGRVRTCRQAQVPSRGRLLLGSLHRVQARRGRPQDAQVAVDKGCDWNCLTNDSQNHDDANESN